MPSRWGRSGTTPCACTAGGTRTPGVPPYWQGAHSSPLAGGSKARILLTLRRWKKSPSREEFDVQAADWCCKGTLAVSSWLPFDVQLKGNSDGSLHGKSCYVSSINFSTFEAIRERFVLTIVAVSSFLFQAWPSWLPLMCNLRENQMDLWSINLFTFGKIRDHFVLAIVVVSSFLFASASMAEHERNPVWLPLMWNSREAQMKNCTGRLCMYHQSSSSTLKRLGSILCWQLSMFLPFFSKRQHG